MNLPKESCPLNEPVSAEIHIDNTGRGMSAFDVGELRIKKTITADNKVQVVVNEKVLSQEEFLGKLAFSGLQPNSPLNFILQGKAKQVSQLDPFGLFNVFSNLVGSSIYTEARAESESLLASTVLDERKSLELLEEFRERLSDLEVDKEDFDKFEKSLKETNRIYHVLYDKKITKNKRRLEEGVEKLNTLKENLKTVYSKEQELRQQQETIEANIRTKESELSVLQSGLNSMRNEVGKMSIGSSTRDDWEVMSVQSVSSTNTDSKTIQNQLEEMTKSRDQIAKELIKADKEQRELKEKITMLTNKAFSLRTSLSQTPPKAVESKITSLQEEANKRTITITELTKREKSYKASLDLRSQSFREIENKKDHTARELPLVLEGIVKQKEIKNEIAAKLVEVGAEVCSLKQTLSESLIDLASKRKKLGTKHGDIPISSLIKLLEEAKKRNIPGVHGLLIDLIDIPDKLYMAFEKLMSKKLFSVVVDDETTAATLINLNKEIKGGKINIYPLSWSRDHVDDFTYPDPDKDRCIILHSSFNISNAKLSEDKSFENLLKTVTRGQILVENLTDAQKLAKNFDCSCVTIEGEVVYQGAIVNKLGYFDYQEKLIPQYSSFSSLLKKVSEIQSQIASLETKKTDLQQAENIANLKVQELNSQKYTLLRNNEEIWEDLILTKKTLVHEEKLIADCREQILEEEKSIELINKEISHFNSYLNDPSKAKQQKQSLESELEIVDDQLSKESEKYKSATRDLSNLITKLGTVESQIESSTMNLLQANKQGQVIEAFQNQSRLESDLRTKGHQQAVIIETRIADYEQKETGFKLQLQKLRDQFSRINLEADKIHNEVSQISKLLQEQNQHRFDIQITIDNFESKLKGLNIDAKQDETQLWQLGKKTDKELIELLKRQMMAKLKYTQKDRNNFEKLEEHFKVYGEYSSEIKELTASKKTFSKLVGNLFSRRNNRQDSRQNKPEQI